MDFYKAFDTVSHTTLWLVLSRTGIQGKMLTMLRGMYASSKACVSCSGSELSDYFECLQGLKQGCLCSPILFTYFINELANGITRGGIHGIQLMPNQIEMFLMLFPDDLALLSSTVRGLQNHLSVCLRLPSLSVSVSTLSLFMQSFPLFHLCLLFYACPYTLFL